MTDIEHFSMNLINVVCGIIKKDAKIFIARRAKHKSMAGKWEFPGGKVENFETETQALKRELNEEFGMKVEVDEYLGSNIHTYHNFRIKLIAYKCEFISASFELTDHDKFEWISKENLNNYDLTEADIPIIDLI